MHSRYVAGVPAPWFMLRQPIHFAPGAMPIWLAPSWPTAVPMVWVPWPLSSQGAAASLPHGPAAGVDRVVPVVVVAGGGAVPAAVGVLERGVRPAVARVGSGYIVIP